MKKSMLITAALLLGGLALTSSSTLAQETTPWTTLNPGTDNITVVGHIPLGGTLSVMDMEIEQDMSSPVRLCSPWPAIGELAAHAVWTSLTYPTPPANPEVSILRWVNRERGPAHRPRRAWTSSTSSMPPGRCYVVLQSTQFGPGPDLRSRCAVIFDVTGLPDRFHCQRSGPYSGARNARRLPQHLYLSAFKWYTVPDLHCTRARGPHV